MNKYPESNRWQDDYPDDDWDFLGPDSDMEAERVAYATEAMSRYVGEDKPDQPWQKVMKRQLNPKVVGALVAIGFAAALVLDVVVNNNPSSLVVNHPEAATLGLTGGAALAGLGAAKITSDVNAKEISRARKTEREQRKAKENR